MEDTIFISFISEERGAAEVIRNLIVETFPGSVNVFMSYYSLKPSDDWLKSIKDHLNKSKIIISLIGPLGIIRPWINCEIGYAWATEKTCIPIVHSNVRPTELAPFISKYQILNAEDDKFSESLLEIVSMKLNRGKPSKKLPFKRYNNQLKFALRSSFTPGQAIIAWHRALASGNISAAHALTSEAGKDYALKRWGGLENLAQKYFAWNYASTATEILS